MAKKQKKEEVKPVKKVFANAHEHLENLEARVSLIEASLGIPVATTNGGGDDDGDSGGGPGEPDPKP